jgi:hypothetical protein
MSGYDVIGDVHGEADKLEGLLRGLGYEHDGAWRHSERQAVFVGDLVDRGPKQIESVDIVRRMVDAGSAQIALGNHEFNAVAWATPDPDPEKRGEFLRPRGGPKGAKNRHQHSKFLAAVGEESARHREIIGWFMTIPMWLDLGGLRVIHACWDEKSMAVLRPLLTERHAMTEELVVRASRHSEHAYDAVETLIKGPEIDLPAGHDYIDKDGTSRKRARFSWWDSNATTLRSGAEIPGDARGSDGGPMRALPEDPIGHLGLPRYTDSIPVIYGHYWRTGTPRIVTPTTACVDYSACRGGALVAYRWNGETALNDGGFVSFDGVHLTKHQETSPRG